MYQVFVKKEALEEVLKGHEVARESFDYPFYEKLMGIVDVQSSNMDIAPENVKVSFLTIARNVYKNEVLYSKRTRKLFCNDSVVDRIAPLDDYPILKAKEYLLHLLEKLSPTVISKSIIRNTSLKLVGAMYCEEENTVYILTQIIFLDSVMSQVTTKTVELVSIKFFRGNSLALSHKVAMALSIVEEEKEDKDNVGKI